MATKNKTNEAPAKSTSKLINTATDNKVPFSVVEAYKNLRVHLISLLSDNNDKVIAVTSPNASEGKSTTAINIAISLSQLSKKVLLIDTDAKRASVHKKLNIENGLGCLDIVSGNAEYKDVIKNYNPNLDVITSGTAFNNSSELFSSGTFERLITEVRNDYDYIIVDTPPVNLVSDTLVVAQLCDSVLFVVRADVTTYEAFKNAFASTERLNIKTLGVILNGVGTGSEKYYKYKKYNYYGYYGYYGYGRSRSKR